MKNKVVIEVSGGIAEVTSCPDHIEVEIIDHDNIESNESRYFKCENCGNYQHTAGFFECSECGYEDLIEITESEYDRHFISSGFVKCNNCESIVQEENIIYDNEEDEECCPYCGESGCLMNIK